MSRRPPHHARLNRRPAPITVAIRVTISAGVITEVIAEVIPVKSMLENAVALVCLSSSFPLRYPAYPGWLRRADSNCRFLMQSQACCRYTTPRYVPAEVWGNSAGYASADRKPATCQRLCRSEASAPAGAGLRHFRQCLLMENSEPMDNPVENLSRGRFSTGVAHRTRVYHSILPHLGAVLALPGLEREGVISSER